MKDNQPLAVGLAEEFRVKLGVDSRFAVLEGETILYGGADRHVFRVSSAYLKDAVHRLAANRLGATDFEVLLLPMNVPVQERCALCSASVAPVVRTASHRSEQVTQFLIGEAGEVLETTPNGWVRIRLQDDGYLGWVSRNQVELLTLEEGKRRLRGKLITARRKIAELHAEPSKRSEAVNELLAGTALPLIAKRASWYGLRLPDGRTGWIERLLAQPKSSKPRASTSEEILRTAKTFLGIPYVWGGRSVKGFDCSGFTQTVYRLHGVELPRDAALQWRCGIDAGKRVEDLAEGDLLFFGPQPESATHVGIALGERGEFIHSSGRVMVSSLSPGHPKYEENRARTFLGARRLGTVG